MSVLVIKNHKDQKEEYDEEEMRQSIDECTSEYDGFVDAIVPPANAS